MPSVDLGNVVGPQGPAPDITATASVDNNSGTPSVNVTKTGSTATPNFDFAFHNLHGVVDSALSTSSENPVQNKVVTNALADKVDTTSLPTATVGNANELNTATPTASATSYIKRQTTGNVERIKKIVGASVVWNQLFAKGSMTRSTEGTYSYDSTTDTHTYTVTIRNQGYEYLVRTNFSTILNHKYLISAYYNGTNITYAWMKASGSSNTPTAQAYTGAKRYTFIQNANDISSSQFLVGFSGNAGTSVTVNVKEIVCIDLTQMFGSTIADYIYTLEQTEAGSGIAFLESYGFDLSTYHAYDAGSIQSVCVSGKKNESTERSVTYPFSPTQLRGLFKLDSNTLYADGDEYTADGSGSIKYKIVDLGTITPVMYTVGTSQLHLFRFALSDIKRISSTAIAPNAITNGYITVSSTVRTDKTVSQAAETDAIDIIDNGYSDATSFKTAMSGHYLVYEKKTASSAQLTPYSEYQTIYPNGTEEWIDGLTRDFTVPVYNDIETFVSNSKSIIAEDDVFDGYGNWLRKKADLDEIIALLGDDESGNTKASRAYSVNEFFYKDGAVFKVTASIAGGATFTVGTNCTQTTIFAVLTALLNA